MKRPPRYIDIMINTEIRFDTHRLLKFIRESNEYDVNLNQITQSIDELKKNRDNKIDMITDKWIIDNWDKIIGKKIKTNIAKNVGSINQKKVLCFIKYNQNI